MKLTPRWPLAAAGLAGLVVAALAVNYLRPVPALVAVQSVAASISDGAQPPALPWPAGGQAAIGAEGAGVLASTPGARPQPIASVAKIMTALLVVEARPLMPGAQGGTLTVSSDDLAVYQQEKAGGQSVVAVQAGEQLTEYQALQGLLLPSGNNLALLLARWVDGDQAAFVRRMNARAHQLNLGGTSFADASGFSPQTQSVPADLVRLGEVALGRPVLREIVGQAQADLPVAGTVYNVNYALGQDGIVGIKTGSTPAAGSVYLFAGTDLLFGGRRLLIVGAVQGLPSLDVAFAAARRLLDAVRVTLGSRRLVARDQAVGSYRSPWGGATDVVATRDLEVLTWPGTVLRERLETRPVVAPLAAQSPVGTLRVTSGDQLYDLPVATDGPLFAPGRRWRLTRPP